MSSPEKQEFFVENRSIFYNCRKFQPEFNPIISITHNTQTSLKTGMCIVRGPRLSITTETVGLGWGLGLGEVAGEGWGVEGWINKWLSPTPPIHRQHYFYAFFVVFQDIAASPSVSFMPMDAEICSLQVYYAGRSWYAFNIKEIPSFLLVRVYSNHS